MVLLRLVYLCNRLLASLKSYSYTRVHLQMRRADCSDIQYLYVSGLLRSMTVFLKLQELSPFAKRQLMQEYLMRWQSCRVLYLYYHLLYEAQSVLRNNHCSLFHVLANFLESFDLPAGHKIRCNSYECLYLRPDMQHRLNHYR